MALNNELKEIKITLLVSSEEVTKSTLYGLFSSLILSKKYASNNSELASLMAKFNLEFRDYVYKSRTVLLSRVIRIIEKKDESEIDTLIKELLDFLLKSEEIIKASEAEKNTKKKKKNIFDDIFNQIG